MNLIPFSNLKNPWEKHAHNVWLASTLSVSRNLSKFKFPNKLDKAREDQVISLLFEELKTCPNLSHPSLYRSESIGPIQKEFLLEHFMVTNDFYRAHSGEGFVTDRKWYLSGRSQFGRPLSKMLLIDTQQEIEKSCGMNWSKMKHIWKKTLDFAFSPRFGFLTADPRSSGTGLVVTLFLHIPAIIHTGELPELLEKEKEEDVEAVGMQGKTTEMIGDILVARNICTLGLTEEYILTTMRMWATKSGCRRNQYPQKTHGKE